MRVTVHAAQRFLERAFEKKNYSYEDVSYATRFLENLLSDVVVTGYKKQFVVPGFKRLRAVCVENTIVTIIPKGVKHV